MTKNTRRKQPGHSLGHLCALCLCIHAPAEPGTEPGTEELMRAVWTEELAWDLPHRTRVRTQYPKPCFPHQAQED